ncbi:uncharacterized protein LOC122854656 isoform X2 [Aphidius gifuensis]|uniref:uncharacterized protein LOC122854656 isoform X2 n=1 Tax=Aphidius gifuensis TaxID=684658 RepID=UPI001CDC4E87|nr:uncharacterized protein LOC122854656 isoform X2 [Aphidius gifuensis]
MSMHADFITGLSPQKLKNKKKKLNLNYSYPKFENLKNDKVLQTKRANPRSVIDKNLETEDGLYVSPNGPLTYNVIKPYKLDKYNTIVLKKNKQIKNKKLVEISIRDVIIHPNDSTLKIKITSVQILFNNKIICKISSPFNRKLYKLLVNNDFKSNDLSVKIQTQNNCNSILPFPLPQHCVKEKKINIDFSIKHSSGIIFSGTLIYTVSLSIEYNEDEDDNDDNYNDNISRAEQLNNYSYKLTNDPNDPQSCLLFLDKINPISEETSCDYFLLGDPALQLDNLEIEKLKINNNKPKKDKKLIPDVVISEEPAFSLWDISIGNWFQASRPLRPSSATNTQKIIRTINDDLLTITVLRGIEIPVREDTSLVQPIVQIKAGELIETTTTADGSSPIWQQTLNFELSKLKNHTCIKLSLYDQHPVWGLQWLGQSIIPLEFNQNNQEFEKWISLSPLNSPLIRFGYIQNNQTYDAARFVMLLTQLPNKYGPLTPRQAIKLNKVDHYGRACLLVTLFQGINIDAYVVIGNSQAKKLTAYVLTIEDKDVVLLWDPENGDKYNLGDSRCSLIKINRLINHTNIWKNLQTTITPSNLRFNVNVAKDWQPLGINSTVKREPQILENDDLLIDNNDDNENNNLDIENKLKDKLSQWRSSMGFTTVFNRHAATVLRNLLTKLSIKGDGQYDKKDLKQLNRAYVVHGFVLNLRCTPIDELVDLFETTKIQQVTGAVEFAIVCHLQKYVGKTSSLWLAVVVLKSRN